MLQALTDLVDKWYLFWMDANNIVEYNCPSSGHAIGAIDVVLNGELKDEEGKKSSLATRRKIDLPPMEGKAMPVCSCLQMTSTCSATEGPVLTHPLTTYVSNSLQNTE